MAFQISPGVNVSEVDQTTIVPSVLTTAGAFAGIFGWGPANKIKLIDNELTLVKTFGKPTRLFGQDLISPFFTASNFLSYGNNLSVVRAISTDALNATSTGTQILISNEDEFYKNHLLTNNGNVYGPFTSRYAGSLGNGLKVSVCDNSDDFANWTYKGYFLSAPGTSDQALMAGGLNDEMHIIVIDTNGNFGPKNGVLETFAFVSKAFDSKLNGKSNFYKQNIFNNSQYIYAIDAPDYENVISGDTLPSSTTFDTLSSIKNYTLSGGSEGTFTDADLEIAYDLFMNKENVDISLILTGSASEAVQNYVITNIAETRKDCLAFISPSLDPNGLSNNTLTDIESWLDSLSLTSSFAVADSGWKYQYDKYNNMYQWIPLNGDIAGLCVSTDTTRDPWFSPAGLNRGQIKNCIKLLWNPNKTQRDVLYGLGVNPVVSFPGQGTVLFGDKTMLNKPNAFDRINVRRLFIVLEKAIAKASQSSLFEMNDEFTRAQFVSLITPFLRDIQGRRGITDFKVICDTTNNTPQVIDSNQFVGDIYIKPSRSINFIQLNFVAVGTGVDFTTIVGAV